MVDVGDTTIVSWNPGTTGLTVTLTATAPDGTTSAPTVTETAGVYAASLATPQAGRYRLRWASPTATNSDVLNVWPVDPRALISFDEAVAALRWRPQEATQREDDLRLHIAAATEVIEDIVGAVLVRTIVQTADGGKTGVALWERPDEIVEVKVDGTVTTDYVANLGAAIVYAGKDPDVRFPEGRQIIEITYTTGASTTAPSIRDAARILVRHMTLADQSPNPAPVDGGDTSRTPSGFLVPNRVLELCANRRPLPGIA